MWRSYKKQSANGASASNRSFPDDARLSRIGRYVVACKQSIAKTQQANVPTPIPDMPSEETSTSTTKKRVKNEDLSLEEVNRQKKLRRQEQVRVASRRSRHRRKVAMENLKSKVQAFDGLLDNAVVSYEKELQARESRIIYLSKQIAQLQLQSQVDPQVSLETLPSSTNASDSHRMASTDCSEQSALTTWPTCSTAVIPDEYTADEVANVMVWDDERTRSIRNIIRIATMRLHMIVSTTIQPAVTRQTFGWTFEMWTSGALYFAKAKKFFPHIRAYDLAMRTHSIDKQKYMDAFPEVQEKKTVRVVDAFTEIVRTVTNTPGKQPSEALNLQFIAKDESDATNSRWFSAARSIAFSRSSTMARESVCNGHVFEDVEQVTSAGQLQSGCLVQAAGCYAIQEKSPDILMREFAQVAASVVLRWESLFVNDYIPSSLEVDVPDCD